MIFAYTVLALLTYIIVGTYFESIAKDHDQRPTCYWILLLWPIIRKYEDVPGNFDTTIPRHRRNTRLF